MSSNDDLRKALSKLIELMYSRLPEGKTVTVAVVKQLLRQRYATQFSSDFLDAQTPFIESEMKRCAALKQQPQKASHGPSSNRHLSREDSEEDESEDEDSEEDEEESEDEDSEDDEEESEHEDSEEDDEESELEDGEEDEEDEGSSASSNSGKKKRISKKALDDHEEKKSRKREREGNHKEDGDHVPHDKSLEKESPEAVAAGMKFCLKKLRYPCRDRLPEETAEEFLSYLTEEFKKRKLDPQRYDGKAIKRYTMLREVELLQEDGATLHLERTQRAGRGYSTNLNTSSSNREKDDKKVANNSEDPLPATTKFSSSKFLDEE